MTTFIRQIFIAAFLGWLIWTWKAPTSATYTPIPTDMIAFTKAATCPAGWTEYTTSLGRYIVGLPSGGTVEGTAGTALTNLENRAVGQHTHVQNAHNHSQDPHSHTLSGIGNDISIDDDPAIDVMDDTGTMTTSSETATNNPQTATNQNEGSVAGTNGPYVQLMVCRKM